MLICGANDVIGVGQYGYTAVYSGAGVLQAVLGYSSGTGTAGTGLQVLVLLVLSVYTAVLLATCIHLTSFGGRVVLSRRCGVQRPWTTSISWSHADFHAQ